MGEATQSKWSTRLNVFGFRCLSKCCINIQVIWILNNRMICAVPRQRDWHVTLLVESWGSEDTLKDRKSREIRCMVTMLRSSTGIFGDIIFKEGELR
jgi:hypothetical protein